MKQLLVLLFLLCSVGIPAQDIIVMKDGSTIASKVIEVGQNEIKYKKYNNQDGPLYTISKTSVQSINYQNGAKDTFSSSVRESNRYLPNNQNDGVQQYNDKALLLMDKESSMPKKARKMRNIALYVGVPLVVAGLGVGIASKIIDEKFYSDIWPVCVVVGGAGVVCTITSLSLMYHEKKKYQN